MHRAPTPSSSKSFGFWLLVAIAIRTLAHAQVCTLDPAMCSNSSLSVLILGGYGLQGKIFAPRLLALVPNSKVILAGRSEAKLKAFYGELNKQFPNRATQIKIDISSRLALETAPHFDVLVNFATGIKTTYSKDASALIQVMKFAQSRNAHYIDADVTAIIFDGFLEQIYDEVPIAGPVVLTGAGVNSGSAGPLVRAAVARMPNCTEAYWESILQAPPSFSNAADVFAINYQPVADFITDETLGNVTKQFEFDDGKVYSGTPLSNAEFLAIKAALGLQKCGSLEPGLEPDDPNNKPEFSLQGLALELFGRGYLGKWFPGFFTNVLEYYTALGYAKFPSYNSTILQGRAISSDEVTKSKQFTIRVKCPDIDSDELTAMCFLATLEQILDGTIKGNKPVGIAGVAVDGNKFIESLKKQGCLITEHWG